LCSFLGINCVIFSVMNDWNGALIGGSYCTNFRSNKEDLLDSPEICLMLCFHSLHSKFCQMKLCVFVCSVSFLFIGQSKYWALSLCIGHT
jgi:hypothetical protein